MRAWSAHHLVEFLAAVMDEDDEGRALRRAVELCSESLGTEVGAAITGGALRWSVGFGLSRVPKELLEGLPPGTSRRELGDLGVCHVAVARMIVDDDRLLVARRGDDIRPEERSVLEGMARMLGLVLRTVRTLSGERDLRAAQQALAEERLRSVQSLQARQLLLETLLSLQRSISHRAPLSEILQAATSGVSTLLGRPVLLYVDAASPVDTASASPRRPLPASRRGGFQRYGPAEHSRAALAAARAAVAGTDHGGGSGGRRRKGDRPAARLAPSAGEHVATTVHVGGTVTGALVAEVGPDRPWTHNDQRLLVTFAENVSMALTDARTLAAVDAASHDPLTRLPNRALFLRQVERALAKPTGKADRVAVLFIDLDRFKAVNDTLGHAAGDELLRRVAARLSACLRRGASAGRFGGDEFAVLLDHVELEDEAKALAERIIDRLREPFTLETATVVVGASIGIALGGALGADAQELLRDADLAMYRAKKRGGQSWALFEQKMYVEVRERLELEAELESAVTNGQLAVEYAPVVCLADEAVVAVRGRVQWDHPIRGRIRPEVLGPLADETGASVEMGRFVLDRALDDLLSWRAADPDLGLSLKLSPRQLYDPRLASYLDAAITRRRIPPELLTLTVGEDAMGERRAIVEVAHALKAVGVELAVDDFSGGAAALAYLQDLPIDALRIARSLVEGLGRSPGAATLARGAIELAIALGIRSVADGIETDGQLAELRAASCRYGEGPYFSGPLDAAGVGALLKTKGAFRCAHRRSSASEVPAGVASAAG